MVAGGFLKVIDESPPSNQAVTRASPQSIMGSSGCARALQKLTMITIYKVYVCYALIRSSGNPTATGSTYELSYLCDPRVSPIYYRKLYSAASLSSETRPFSR